MNEVKEKPQKVERAFLVGIQKQGQDEREALELLDELEELVTNLEIATIGKMVVKLRAENARYLVGTGKLAEIVEEVQLLDADVIIFDDALSPSQQRNWERDANVCVIDRREVILDIFSDRATTREARLQIQLARAEYDMPRLTRAWTHLSRQRGAANMKGEGERQLELDRRMVRQRIQRLQADLKAVRKQRATQRKQRRKRPVPNAALVGYTNAGKSSLLNYLTNAGVYAADKLFATLDPTTKKIVLSNNQELLLTDTVGFIRKLPHDLVEAFKATLEEAVLADFLLHVVDCSNPDALEHMHATMDVLEELGAEKKRILTVFNKIDMFTDDTAYMLPRLRSQYPDSYFISAKSGEGVDSLLKEMETILEEELIEKVLRIPMERYELIALLHRTSHILSEEYDGNFVDLSVALPRQISSRFEGFEVEV